ncbi:MAG: hypothetical protein EPN88_08445 [Bacteroidetes bacterium]|nr:MAG: hypothetical protein EPN88_08445 [Bacteroidota bacterium]
MKFICYTVFIFIFCLDLKGQAPADYLTGKVSFVSTQNIYVKFASTAGISAGDTLYISSNDKLVPVLRVNNLSSASCVCTTISGVNLSVADEVTARIKKSAKKPVEKIIENVLKETKSTEIPVVSDKKKLNPDELKQKIRGSLSAYSYSDFSNTSAKGSTRLRYNFTIDARNISNSKFSVENYMSFNHKLGDWGKVKSNIFNALKIYSLSVRYDLNKTTKISLGRRINPRMSSIGAMDGLQLEKTINNFTLGALAGTRPDFINYGFNGKLFQYGAYLAYNTIPPLTYSETSLAFMQQMNSGKTDRRFIYFQHSNSLIKNIYFLSTFEVDLFKMKGDTLNNYTPQNTFNLTGLYLSLRYKMTNKITLTGSYDGRKNVMYYETYKTFIDRIIETEMRQSIRLQADYRITNSLIFGVQSGYRYLKSDPHASKNLYTYLTYSQIPGLNLSATLSGSYLESNYLTSKILGLSISRDFFQGKFYTQIGYHYMDYKYPESLMSTIQNVAEMNISWLFAKTMSFSVNYEGTFEKQNKYNRVFLQIRKRF